MACLNGAQYMPRVLPRYFAEPRLCCEMFPAKKGFRRRTARRKPWGGSLSIVLRPGAGCFAGMSRCADCGLLCYATFGGESPLSSCQAKRRARVARGTRVAASLFGLNGTDLTNITAEIRAFLGNQFPIADGAVDAPGRVDDKL